MKSYDDELSDFICAMGMETSHASFRKENALFLWGLDCFDALSERQFLEYLRRSVIRIVSLTMTKHSEEATCAVMQLYFEIQCRKENLGDTAEDVSEYDLGELETLRGLMASPGSPE